MALRLPVVVGNFLRGKYANFDLAIIENSQYAEK
jgi:hypothetical protein